MTLESPIRSISCVGLGLIGMSLLQAIKNSPLASENPIHFQGFDPNFTESDRLYVQKLGLDAFIDNKKILYSADLLVLAAPVEVNIALLEEIKQLAPPSTLVTDVSSTKSLIAMHARKLGVPFIGMHPMAGKEQNGYRESNAELLRGKRIIFCDDQGLIGSEKVTYLIRLLESAGCTTLCMTPDEHDRIIARISHLPQLLSTMLTLYCGEAISASGPGFATLARLAGSSWEIWRDIIATNSDNIAEELDHFSAELSRLSLEVRQHDLQGLESRFCEANRLYQTLKEMNRS